MYKNPLKLHLGAFDCPVEGWWNSDITPHIWIARMPFAARLLHRVGAISSLRLEQHRAGVFRQLHYLNVMKPLPFPDNSVSAVFSSHVFEHLFLNEIQPLIREIWRVLVPGGVCRTVVPDLEKIVSLYDRDDPDAFLCGMFEATSRTSVRTAHHFGFTSSSISRLFAAGGFSDCYVAAFREGRCPDVELLDNRSDSLFFEAVK